MIAANQEAVERARRNQEILDRYKGSPWWVRAVVLTFLVMAGPSAKREGQ